MNKKMYKFFKTIFFTLAVMFLVYNLVSVVFLTASRKNVQYQDMLTKINLIKNASYNMQHKNFDMLNFALSNDIVSNSIKTSNSIDLIRYTNNVIKSYNFDGAMIASKRGEILVKSDFVKISQIKEATDIINDVFQSKVVSTMIKIKKDDLDEGLKFLYNQKNAKNVNLQSEDILVLVTGMPIFDNRSNLIGIFIGIRLINGDQKYINNMKTLVNDAEISVITNNNIISTSNSDKKALKNLNNLMKKKLGKKGNKKDFFDEKRGIAYINIYDYDKKNVAYIVLKFGKEFNKSSWMFLIISIILFITTLIVLLGFLNWYRKKIAKPLIKIDEIIENISSNQYKLPLLDNSMKTSIFYDTIKRLYKIASLLKKNEKEV